MTPNSDVIREILWAFTQEDTFLNSFKEVYLKCGIRHMKFSQLKSIFKKHKKGMELFGVIMLIPDNGQEIRLRKNDLWAALENYKVSEFQSHVAYQASISAVDA
jgi:hypothetical protein